MKVKIQTLFIALMILAGVNQVAAQGTAFTYQGRLNSGNAPAGGSYDFVFVLFNDSQLGSQIGSAETNTAVTLTNGLFTTTLDFGSTPLGGQSLWLEVLVRTNGTGAFSELFPRQPVTPAPYAVYANVAGNVSGTVSAAQLGGTILNSTLPGSPSFSGTVAATSFFGDGAGVTGVNAAELNGLTATNFWQLGGNSGTTAGFNFLGTTDNQALEFHVNGQRAFRFEVGGPSSNVESSLNYTNATGAPNVIGGAAVNMVAPGVVGAFIGGGGATNYEGYPVTNSIGDFSDFSTICGGYNNFIQANSPESLIAGGSINIIQADCESAVIAGGLGNYILSGAGVSAIGGGAHNQIGNYSVQSTIAGGIGNMVGIDSADDVISGGYVNSIGDESGTSTIAGGAGNTIGESRSTFFSFVAAGEDNDVEGDFSFAAGHQAVAYHSGAFVWADNQNPTFESTTSNEFNIRSQNGVRIQAAKGIHLDAADEPLIVRDWNVFAANAPADKVGIGRWGLFMEPTILTIGIPANDAGNRYFQVAKYSTDGTATQLLQVDQSGNVISQGTVTAHGMLLSSDRNLKENFTSLDGKTVLAKVMALPVTQWNYKMDNKEVQHIGPMAQDFQAAFQLDGADDKHISVVDEGGVALVAIKGLNEKLDEKDAKISALKKQNDSLAERLNELEGMVRSLAEKE